MDPNQEVGGLHVNSLASKFSVLAASAAFVVATTSAIAAPAEPVHMSVKNWAFAPATIVAHVGMPTSLAFDTKEGVHGVESAELGLPKTMLMPGKITTVDFTPAKLGTYVVHCAIVCGAGHAKMLFAVRVVR